MREYEKPMIIENEGFTEGIYAASGSDTPEVTPGPVLTPIPTPDADGWRVGCEYRNHNTGSHSEVAIIGEHNGTKSGESMKMRFTVRGFRLESVPDSSGYIVSDVTEDGFTVTRIGHFNPTERFEFNIQIKAADSKYNGSVGKTGEYMPCEIFCTDYSSN